MSDTGGKDAADRPGKRSADPQPQPRKKRGRYTLNACDECKRRKTKCSGDTPCQLCRSIGETCEYSRETGEEVTQKYMNSAIQSLQRQIGELSSIVDSLRSEGISHRGDPVSQAVSPAESPKPPRPLAPGPDPAVILQDASSFTAPTTSSFAFNMLDNSLQDSGVSTSVQPSAPASPPLTDADAPERYNEMALADDPLTVITPKDMVRILKLWEEELGLQIPHLEVDRMITCASAHAQQATAGPVARNLPCAAKCYIQEGADSLMRSVVAVVLLLEDHRNRPISQKLMDRLSKSESKRFVEDTKIEPDELSLVIMKSIFHFLEDNERLAWRLMGFAARMCLEIGLHRRKNLSHRFATASERRRAVKLFWCTYVLERRWSFGAGLPPSINDSDVDQQLNETDTASLYLKSMMSYCKIASQVWSSTSSLKSSTDVPSDHDCSYMEFIVLEWHRGLPGVLQLTDPYGGFDPRIHNRGVYRLQVLQYLRANQMRVLIHRPFLFSKTGINSHPEKARKAIDLAKDSIRVLKRLHETSNIYSRQHMVFNHFLDSALAVLLLAVCNEPARTADLVRKEINTALELVHNLSMRSPISKSLWNRLKKYKEVPRRLSGPVKENQKPQTQDENQSNQEPKDQKQAIKASPSGTDQSSAFSYGTAPMVETSVPLDADIMKAYDSLFATNSHMLDGLRGHASDYQGGYVHVPSSNMNLSPNMASGWALNDPTAYTTMVNPVQNVGLSGPMYEQQMDNMMTTAGFDDVSRSMFGF